MPSNSSHTTNPAGVQLRFSLDEFFRVMVRWRPTRGQQRELLGGVSSDTFARLTAEPAPGILESVRIRIRPLPIF
jgi:hypothetical protein